MLTAVGEEYLCFSESNTGQYSPLIGIARYDGTLSFRDLVKDDLTRIHDPEIYPGGWLFRKTMSSTGSWIKRFTIMRGNYLFLFHNPQNEKPIGIIPLDGCRIFTPENQEKSFDEQRSFRANDGYEFDIRHSSRPTVRLYTLSALERQEWVQACRHRCEVLLGSHSEHANDLKRLLPANSNITITPTKLSGVSLTPTFPSPAMPQNLSNAIHTATSANKGTTTMNPFLPPAPLRSSTENHHHLNDNLDVESLLQGTINSLNSPTPSQSQYGGSDLHNSFEAQQRAAVQSLPLHQTPEFSAALGSMITPTKSFHNGPTGIPPPPPPTGSPPPPTSEAKPTTNKFAVNKIKRSIMEAKFAHLEDNLAKIVNDQKEARVRENAFRSKLASKDALAESKSLEEQNPLVFAEIFRLMLYFFEEEVAEDPHPDSKQQCPYAKGKEIEEMLLTVYQRYCSAETGFMSIEQFVQFMEDCAILQTHAEHNDNDEPLDEYIDTLDPVQLIRSLPKNIQALSTSYDDLLGTVKVHIADQRHYQAQKLDKFVINFGQFYQLLLHITQIVYADLYHQDSTVAFNKLLLEVIVPFYLWCKGHHKRGATDPLVMEERIALVMITYAPNLWKVFLNYCSDAVGKMAEINTPFPLSAQLNEKNLFKPPSVIPQKFTMLGEFGKARPDSLIVTETNFLRFARDYGIMPFVCSQQQIREYFQKTNRAKTITASRLPTREQLASGKPHSQAQIMKVTKAKEAVLPMHLGNKPDSHWIKNRNKTGGGPSSPTNPATTATAAPAALQGLGFSEFVELIGRIAVEGLQQQNYHVIFPTPFSKVLALLTVWGIADLRKLEEVRVIRTEENY